MDVHWLEQNEADVPEDDDWLAENELLHLNRLHVLKRRRDWRLGRWTAKLAVASHLQFAPGRDRLQEIEIISECSGAPIVFLRNQPADPIGISISHRAGVAACVVTTDEGALGCDLELIEPHGDAFIADYFTEAEQRAIAETDRTQREALVAALWSAKESALKALRFGLREDTRCVEIDLGKWSRRRADVVGLAPADEWCHLQATYRSEQQFTGWWQFSRKFVRTFVSALPSAAPTFLQGSDARDTSAAPYRRHRV